MDVPGVNSLSLLFTNNTVTARHEAISLTFEIASLQDAMQALRWAPFAMTNKKFATTFKPSPGRRWHANRRDGPP